MLQVREENEHWLLSDERIRLFLGDPRFAANNFSILLIINSEVYSNKAGFTTFFCYGMMMYVLLYTLLSSSS